MPNSQTRFLSFGGQDRGLSHDTIFSWASCISLSELMQNSLPPLFRHAPITDPLVMAGPSSNPCAAYSLRWSSFHSERDSSAINMAGC